MNSKEFVEILDLEKIILKEGKIKNDFFSEVKEFLCGFAKKYKVFFSFNYIDEDKLFVFNSETKEEIFFTDYVYKIIKNIVKLLRESYFICYIIDLETNTWSNIDDPLCPWYFVSEIQVTSVCLSERHDNPRDIILHFEEG